MTRIVQIDYLNLLSLLEYNFLRSNLTGQPLKNCVWSGKFIKDWDLTIGIKQERNL